MSAAENKWMRLFFLLGAALRTALYWMNPPSHAFDDHFKPILYILKNGKLPQPLMCWECHQLPVFYVGSAAVAWVASALGASQPTLFKILQALPLLYALLTLWVLERILSRLALPSRAKLFAYGCLCFLPAHIYISAMHSNDPASFLSVAVAVLALFRAIESGFANRWLVVLSVTLSLAIFTKALNLVVVPMAASALLLACASPCRLSVGRFVAKTFLVFALPAALLVVLGAWYNSLYGTPFIHAHAAELVPLDQLPGRDGMDFWTFKPWTYLEAPLIGPKNVGSFWTLVYGHFWFDVQPMFLWFTDHNDAAWEAYYQYLLRRSPYSGYPALSLWTRGIATGLLLLGLVPLAIGILGACRFLFGRSDPCLRLASEARWQIAPVLVLFACSLIGMIGVAIGQPFFCNTKATILLSGMPAFAVCLALGLGSLRGAAVERSVSVLLGILFALVTAHVVHIFVSMVAVLG